jgi:hypothetical protein
MYIITYRCHQCLILSQRNSSALNTVNTWVKSVILWFVSYKFRMAIFNVLLNSFNLAAVVLYRCSILKYSILPKELLY